MKARDKYCTSYCDNIFAAISKMLLLQFRFARESACLDAFSSSEINQTNAHVKQQVIGTHFDDYRLKNSPHCRRLLSVFVAYVLLVSKALGVH